MPPAMLSEADAIRGAAAGDREAYAEIYRMHRRRVYALCLRMTHNAADAEDLAQEVFIHLFRKIGTFRGESAFSTWLHRLSVNVVLMRLRRKRLPETPLEELSEPMHEDGPQRELGMRDIRLDGTVGRVLLERALARLPPHYRTVFVLHDVEGYGRNEVAARMGCGDDTAAIWLWRARLALRTILARGGADAKKKRKFAERETSGGDSRFS